MLRQRMADVDMSGKTVLITGGNTGIGKETVIGLARMGARVVFTSRNLRKGDVARAHIREQLESQLVDCMELDLASFESIETFAKHFLAKYSAATASAVTSATATDEPSDSQTASPAVRSFRSAMITCWNWSVDTTPITAAGAMYCASAP